MPGGNDSEFNALYAIACSTAEMADAAGGVGQSSGFVTEDDLVSIIACNMRATLLGLGGDPCNYGWTDTDGAWLAILFYSAQLTGLTGTGLNAGSTVSVEGMLYGISCNLDQVAANTGEAAGGTGAGTYLDQLNAIACITAQIVVNGFTPADPVQAFVDSLLPFAPDLLVIADTFVGADGDPVASAPDSSGNNNPMAQSFGPSQPTFSTNAVNGKSAYSFGGNDYLQCPFPGLAGMTSIVVFARSGVNSNINRIATLTNGIDGGDATGATPISQYFDNDVLKSYYGGPNPTSTLIAGTGFHTSSAWLDGVNAHLVLDGVAVTPVAATETPLPTGYAVIGGNNTGNALVGKIAFHARWQTAPSAGNINAFVALVNAYYGL